MNLNSIQFNLANINQIEFGWIEIEFNCNSNFNFGFNSIWNSIQYFNWKSIWWNNQIEFNEIQFNLVELLVIWIKSLKIWVKKWCKQNIFLIFDKKFKQLFRFKEIHLVARSWNLEKYLYFLWQWKMHILLRMHTW